MAAPGSTHQGLEARLAVELLAFPEVAAAYLFGSFARGEERPDSDLDIGLVLARRGDTALEHHRRLRALALRLEHAAGGRRIDLVVLDPRVPIFCHQVLSEGRLIHEADRERRIDFESTAHVRYFDFLPTYEIAAREALAGVRRLLEASRRRGAGEGPP